jgi:hypothetical protein
MVYGGEARGAVLRERGADGSGGDTYFSLPRFFHAGEGILRYGIILKNRDSRAAHDSAAARGSVGRNILLVPVVEREADFSDGEIHRLPGILAGAGAVFITGIRFDDGGMTLFIDPLLLVETMLKQEAPV